MKYIMKAGTLYQNDCVLAQIKGSLSGPEKKIASSANASVLCTNIITLEAPANERGNVRYHQYVLLDEHGTQRAVAYPDYAEDDDPTVVGWPFCRMPRVDHATLWIAAAEYRLVMQNGQNYSVSEPSGKLVVQIFHRGLTGGWNIQAEASFSPEILCAIFVFCKYIERENEFLVV